MPDPEPGLIYWSADAQAFYQQGRRGRISNLEGIESLTVSQVDDNIRLRDQLGHLVPDLDKLIPAYLKEPFFREGQTADLTLRAVYSRPPGQDRYYSTMFTYRDSRGNVRLGFVRGKVGDKLDREEEEARLLRAIGDSLGIEKGSRRGGSENLRNLLGRSFHFLTE